MSNEKKRPEDSKQEIVDPGTQAGSEEERPSGLIHLVSEIKTIEQQVGEHVITALQHEGTVAVLTAVLSTGGGGGGDQRIASVPLDQELWIQVQELLTHSGEEQAQDVPCIGFQCVLEQRQKDAESEKQKPPKPPRDNF